MNRMQKLKMCAIHGCVLVFFFNSKEHSISMNGKCKFKNCAIHGCVMFFLKKKTLAFIQKKLWHLYKKNSGIYTNTVALIQRKTVALIQNTLNVLSIVYG